MLINRICLDAQLNTLFYRILIVMVPLHRNWMTIWVGIADYRWHEGEKIDNGERALMGVVMRG